MRNFVFYSFGGNSVSKAAAQGTGAGIIVREGFQIHRVDVG
ncbi:MAG: hypothetical protein ACR5K4_02245 [Sodalis sp. (in: enterobacteria)]